MIDAVLLVAFGGPTAPAEIRPFLEIVTRGRRIPPERLEEVVHHYEQMPGGRSPLRELTEAQARGLRRRAGRLGAARCRSSSACATGIRSCTRRSPPWRPAAIAARSAIILSSFRTEASWERYLADVAAARERTSGAPEIVFAPPWFEHPRFVAAIADARGRRWTRCRRGARATRRSCSRPTACRWRWPRPRPTSPTSRRPPARSPRASATRAGRSPIRAAAAARAIRGSSRTSAT